MTMTRHDENCFSGMLQVQLDRIAWMQARINLQSDLRRECDYLSSMIQGYPCYGMSNLGKIV